MSVEPITEEGPESGGNQIEAEIVSCPIPEENPNMNIIADPSSKYHGYTVRIGDDYPRTPYVDEDILGRGLMRVHCRVSRTPSKREFVVRSFSGSTDAERAGAAKLVHRVHRMFERAEASGGVSRVLNREGRFWVYYILPGSPIEDPLIQLELEMMIDLGSGVRS